MSLRQELAVGLLCMASTAKNLTAFFIIFAQHSFTLVYFLLKQIFHFTSN